MNSEGKTPPTEEEINAAVAATVAKQAAKEAQRKGPNRAERRRQQRGGKFSPYETKRRSEQLRR